MRRLLLPASLALAVLLPAAAPSSDPAAARAARAERPGCHHRLFTVAMAERAARKVYRGTRDVPARDLRLLTRLKACQRNRAAEPFVYRYYQRERAAWRQRRWDAAHPYSTAYVSQYDDSGGHCCGVYAAYGVADCGTGGGPCYPQGTLIEFCLNGCVTATVDDHGPYAPGREFDLANSTADAIGFSGVGDVYWRLR